VALVLALAAPAGAILRHTRPAPCSEIAWKAAYYQHHDTRPVRRIVRCAVRKWHVAGGVHKAFSVFRCESGFRPDARSPSGSYLGVAQLGQWADRAREKLRPVWAIAHRWSNALANVIVAVRTVHLGSWEPWTCAR
jgi:hypothetical protein